MFSVLDGAKTAYLAVKKFTTPAETIQPLRTIPKHRKPVFEVAFFKDSRQVVSGSGQIPRIWDVEKGTLVATPFEGWLQWGPIRSLVAVSPDDRRVASSSGDYIEIWDIDEQKVHDPLDKHADSITSLCFSPDGKRLASGSLDGTVIILDVETRTELSTLVKNNLGSVFCVAFSPDGSKLASSTKFIIRVWNPDNAELLFDINAHSDWVTSVVWSPDSQQLVSASYDKTIKFRDLANRFQIGQACTGHTDKIYSLAISSDGSFIATASEDKTVRLWGTKSRQQIGQSLEHTKLVFCVAISPSGELLASGDYDGNLQLWPIENTLSTPIKEAVVKYFSWVMLSHKWETKEPLLHDIQGKSIYNLDPVGTVVKLQKFCGVARDAGHRWAWSDTCCIDQNNNVEVQRSVNSMFVWYHHSALTIVYLSDVPPSSKWGALANSIWNTRGWTILEFLAPKIVLFYQADWTLYLDDRSHNHKESVAITQELERSTGINARALVAFRPGMRDARGKLQWASTRVTTLQEDIAYSLAGKDGDKCFTYEVKADGLQDLLVTTTDRLVQFSPARRTRQTFLLIRPWNRYDLGLFWDSSNGTQIGQPCTGHTDNINSLTISSDGSFIATASDDNTVRLWSTKSHKQIGQPLEHIIHVCCIAIAPNGELLVSGDDYGNVQLWSIGNALSASFGLDSSYDSFFAHRSKGRLGRNLYVEALSDADKVIELNPSSHIGYELKHAALHGAQRYDDAFDVFKVMLSNLDNAHDAQMQKLRQKYISASEALEAAVRRAIYAQLENAPLRLINTSTGRLCNRDAQIDVFIESTEYKELLSSSVIHGPLQTETIKEVVAKYFSWVMLSHRWERKEPLLHDIQDNDIYDLDPVGAVVKLQKFCKVARDAGHRWAWSDTCCIDQNNNVEVQQSVNSMFVWYHYSALTIVYLSDVPPSSESGALANSIWNTRGWTVQEFLAPKIVLFYQADWTLYLDNYSRNHKESVAITQELERSTGINARALVAFRPGTRDARVKLQWASHRETTREEDIAYSLFGIFDVNLPVIYGEKRQKALGRLLQEIIAHSGDITALDWVGQPSNFNSCLPADISSYKALSFTPPSLSEDEMRTSVSMLRNIMAVESASKLYTTLENLGVPRFANCRLQLPCIAFPLTEIRQRPGRYVDQYFIYDIKADGLHDLSITTEDQLVQFWAGRPVRRKVLLIRPWTHHLLEPSNFAELPSIDDESSVEDYWSAPGSPLHDSPPGSPGEQGPVNSELSERAFRLVVHLGQPFSAFLLTQQRGGEYTRIASDNDIIVQVTDATCVENFMDVRTLEIL
ncbi:WD40 repeat-like protein [Suillus hirtellus]|nr:WD40 repeat-like protein [Suillus hirtellus]